MIARITKKDWSVWGNQTSNYLPNWPTYQYNSGNGRSQLSLLENQTRYSKHKIVKTK